MKVKACLTFLGDKSVIDEDDTLTLEKNTTIKQALDKLKVTSLQPPLLTVQVNGRNVELTTKLVEGDIISFSLNIMGG